MLLHNIHISCKLCFFREEKFDPSIIRVYPKNEVDIYQSPGYGHCVVHSVIHSMRDQGLKAVPTAHNLIDMVIFEILNNLNFYGAFINAEEVDFIEELERYENF